MGQYLIASSGSTLDSKISGRFGHAKYYIIVNPKTMEYEVFPGVDKDDRRFDIGKIINQETQHALVGNIGPASFDELKWLGVHIYLCRNMKTREAIEKVYNNEVDPLESPTLEESIFSGRKFDDNNEAGRSEEKRAGIGGGGKGSGKGFGPGRGLGKSKGKKNGQGRKKGRR
jgi:predicted Fe-Mo cluster-binding NifX family protein